jgi:hypothetical protein
LYVWLAIYHFVDGLRMCCCSDSAGQDETMPPWTPGHRASTNRGFETVGHTRNYLIGSNATNTIYPSKPFIIKVVAAKTKKTLTPKTGAACHNFLLHLGLSER